MAAVSAPQSQAVAARPVPPLKAFNNFITGTKTQEYLANGAQPTDTARSLLSREGVMLKKHLLEGVKKGAFDEATAEKKYADWKEQKAQKLAAISGKVASDKAAAAKALLEQEAKICADRAEAIAKKKAEAEAAKAAAEAEAAAATEAEPILAS